MKSGVILEIVPDFVLEKICKKISKVLLDT